ncbi:hypothetical protein H8D57_01035 [bacterium]|nr:hypothetical protein [bacterium]
MSSKLPAWARGPYELIEHAEGHFNRKNDTDRRIALVGFDNAIEVAITTYLQLNPKLRSGRAFPRKDVDGWLLNYHTKIAFFEQFVDDQKIPLKSSITEIIWFHSLRNELYHSGNGMVPERHCLEGIRLAALEVFKVLYEVDVEPLLKDLKGIRPTSEEQNVSTITKRTLFLQSYINLEETLRKRALRLGFKADSRSETFLTLWKMFKSQYEADFTELDQKIQKAQFVRNNLVHGGIVTLDEEEIVKLSQDLDMLSKYIVTYEFSINILDALKDRYGDWVKADITNVRIIHKDRIAWLEVTTSAKGFFDEETKRLKLDFISNFDEENEFDDLLFSPETSAQGSADRFFDDMDLYSILMVGIGDLIFTEEGEAGASMLCETKDGKPLGNITRRPATRKGHF